MTPRTRYPHVRIDNMGDPSFISTCRCGAGFTMPQVSLDPPYTPAPQTWGDDCPAALRATIAGYEAECAEIDQTLGRALGYPPNPDGAPGVCTGDHTPASLAAEAAGRIAEAESTIASAVAAGMEHAARMCEGRATEREGAAEVMRREGQHADAARYLTYATAERCCGSMIRSAMKADAALAGGKS